MNGIDLIETNLYFLKLFIEGKLGLVNGHLCDATEEKALVINPEETAIPLALIKEISEVFQNDKEVRKKANYEKTK